MADQNDVRPDWLKPYALVTGKLSSAPLDLAGRMEKVYAALQADGWRVSVRSIGTDFSGPLGIPRPKDQPLELYLLNLNGPTTADSAKAELKKVLKAMDLNYSAVSAWGAELSENVIKPTIQDTEKLAKKASIIGLPLLGIGIVVALTLSLTGGPILRWFRKGKD